MRYVFPVFVLATVLYACGHTYYIVRHAEKAGPPMHAAMMMMTNDPPLSEEGNERALLLKELMQNKKIGHVFATHTIRSKSTAQPTADYFGLEIEMYKPVPDSAWISRLKSLSKNTLIVGHSNTVDDIVNKLCGKIILQDLQDNAYDNLFIVRKKGKRFILSRRKYGPSSE
jgi:phosphohistidine phosphatase SixA